MIPRHLICSPESGEGISPQEFDILLSTVKVILYCTFCLAKKQSVPPQTNEDGLVRIGDIVHLLESL